MCRIIIPVALAVFIITSLGCNKQQTGAGTPKAKNSVGAAQSEEDGESNKHFEALVAGKVHDGDKAEEARAWLNPRNSSNVLWKTTRAQTLQYVDDLYDAGAVKVYCVFAPKDGAIPVNMCAELLIVLPTDAAARKKVIKAYNKIDKQMWGPDHEPMKDDGRKFLDLSMDP